MYDSNFTSDELNLHTQKFLKFLYSILHPNSTFIMYTEQLQKIA